MPGWLVLPLLACPLVATAERTWSTPDRESCAAQRRGVAALRMENLRLVFLTHLHSDHTLGLPDLILTPWVLDRTAPLEVYGPAGTGGMVRHLLAAYRADIENRRTHDQPHNDSGWRVRAHEILREVRAGFSGPVAYGNDLDVF